MTSDDRFTTPATTGVRSPEYNDGLTVQDTTHSAAPREETRFPGASAFDGRPGDDTAKVDETGDLIGADKVIGTAVYNAAGERLGTVDSIMVGKRSGKVAYAVMSFGGFLGIGERYHPLPWDVLTYDTDKGGYNIQHSADDLRKAPNYSRDEVDTLDYSTTGGMIDSYYGLDIDRGSRGYGRTATGVEAADAIGSTPGAGSSGMGSTGMGANRNF